MASNARLRGVRVLVVGAGLAGLSAARRLEREGATVALIDARDRVGGRVWTIRDGFLGGQHAEAGADLIESDQTTLRHLIQELGLETAPILRRGFGYYGTDGRGRVRVQPISTTFAVLGERLAPLIRDYRVSEQRWDSAIARQLASQSVADWLKSEDADPALITRVRALRGLFLADPEALSLLALVDFFATDANGGGDMCRVVGGNDQVTTAMAARLARPPELRAVLRRVRRTDRGVVATLETPGGLAERAADYLVAALPASTLRDVVFEPALPRRHQDAIARLRYGPATRVLLQFQRRFWRKPGRPLAFGSDQPTGAVWDGSEDQRGPEAILTLLAGGGASAAMQDLLNRDGVPGVVGRLGWLGRPAPVLHARAIVWDDDPWARGGYAYFDASFDPLLRDVLAQPAGRVVFAGEHTSHRWQGYMNGAVESGYRAAAEIRALEILEGQRAR